MLSNIHPNIRYIYKNTRKNGTLKTKIKTQTIKTVSNNTRDDRKNRIRLAHPTTTVSKSSLMTEQS